MNGPPEICGFEIQISQALSPLAISEHTRSTTVLAAAC
jgi:hypothetical protein